MGTNWIAALYQKRFIKRMNDLGAVEIGPENMAMRTHASGVTDVVREDVRGEELW